MDRAAERALPLIKFGDSFFVHDAIHIARVEAGLSREESYVTDDGILRLLLSCGAIYFTNHWGMVRIDEDCLNAWAAKVRFGADPLEAAGLCGGDWEAAWRA